MELKDKTVLVTGSTRGIGYAIARAFAQEGATVIVNGRSGVAEETLRELASNGGRVLAVCGDISDEAQVDMMMAEIKDKVGPIDILVNNAGITDDQLLVRMSLESFNRVVQVNLTGTFLMTQAVLPQMMRQRSGAIINLASVSGLMGNIGQGNYAASKAGVIGLTKTTAREVARRGVTCNALAPGYIETDMTEVLAEQVKDTVRAQIPLLKFGQPEDVAQAAIFLAKNNYITGQVLNVDGGMVMNG